MGIEELQKKYKELEERVTQLEFREELIVDNNNVSRILLEYNITRKQYIQIMDLMDDTRNSIETQKEVLSAEFEKKLINIFDGDKEVFDRSPSIDYHFCEYIVKAFMEDGRWEEVFPALYGNLQKYQFLKGEDNER